MHRQGLRLRALSLGQKKHKRLARDSCAAQRQPRCLKCLMALRPSQQAASRMPSSWA